MIFSKIIFLRPLLGASFVLGLALFTTVVSAVTISDIRSTKHNLSVSGPGTVNADSETQVCVFCHTPHAATSGTKALWNRTVGTGYTRYTSSSLDANVNANGFNDQPGGSSLLCLSCHDGQVALGNVNVLNGAAGSISVNGSTTTKMHNGNGSTTGYTRNLGVNLTNDHPVSITYNEALADLDEELKHMDSAQKDIETGGDIIGIPSTGYQPLLPLEPTGVNGLGQVQCGTCHDPHLFDPADPNRKFLRLNRLQTNAAPTSDAFNPDNDIICLGCHKKDFASWGQSAHANSTVADEEYKPDAALLREFPPGTKVWQASCLNCHDTHTVQGSRRLLREGVSGSTLGVGAGAYKQGQTVSDNSTVSGIEETCFQCHQDELDGRITEDGDGAIPSVKSLFKLPYGMPLGTASQGNGNKEVHDIKNGNLEEDPTNLGLYNSSNRHAECTDCHNPHRVRRSKTFNGGIDSEGTHVVGGPNGNIASGVLRGTWGVEPVFGYSSTKWPTFPTFFDVKKGDPGNAPLPTSRSDSKNATYLTREYQLCFKCHSNYSNGNTPADFPLIGYSSGAGSCNDEPDKCDRGTPSSQSNGMLRYTNVAAEFGSVIATDPATSDGDQGEVTNTGSACGGGDCNPSDINHRSWHPVVFPTGRDRKERGMHATNSINLLAPFAANIGKQTMHCSDCHGQASSWTAGSGPNSGVQGPHGSNHPFMLRGNWTQSIQINDYSVDINNDGRALCANCHDPKASTGFDGNNSEGRHQIDGNMNQMACMNCHIAVPHGWKNKAFLVNRNCVGSEVGRTSSLWTSGQKSSPSECQKAGSYGNALDEPPYYYNAYLFVDTWRRSGNWSGESTCGGGAMTDCRK